MVAAMVVKIAELFLARFVCFLHINSKVTLKASYLTLPARIRYAANQAESRKGAY